MESILFSKEKFKLIKFFKTPCVACIHFQWDGEIEWSFDNYVPICNHSCDRGLEFWQENKKDFPNVEAPAKCIRKNM